MTGRFFAFLALSPRLEWQVIAATSAGSEVFCCQNRGLVFILKNELLGFDVL